MHCSSSSWTVAVPSRHSTHRNHSSTDYYTCLSGITLISFLECFFLLVDVGELVVLVATCGTLFSVDLIAQNAEHTRFPRNFHGPVQSVNGEEDQKKQNPRTDFTAGNLFCIFFIIDFLVHGRHSVLNIFVGNIFRIRFLLLSPMIPNYICFGFCNETFRARAIVIQTIGERNEYMLSRAAWKAKG